VPEILFLGGELRLEATIECSALRFHRYEIYPLNILYADELVEESTDSPRIDDCYRDPQHIVDT